MLVLALLAFPLDEVFLADGSVVREVTVVEETIQQVRWKKGRAETVKPSGEVLRVVHDEKVDAWAAALGALEGGRYDEAVAAFREAAEDRRVDREEYRWLRAYGLFEAANALRASGKYDEAVAAYDVLLAKVPDTRFYGEATLRKASCFRVQGNAAKARQILEAFSNEVSGKGIPERWRYQAELDLLLLDASLSPSRKRDRLLEIRTRALDQAPTVANRASVEIGNTYVAEKDFRQAQSYFEAIVEDPKTERDVAAGAWLGLGDCHFQGAGGTGEEKSADYKKAVLAYLRVATVYRDEIGYVPRALFHAGRSFDLLGDPTSLDRAQQMYALCERDFPGTREAKEASQWRRRR